jgi:hypothetical protein
VNGLQELRERRAYECRLTPHRGLETLDEAEEFLRDRGLLTRTTDSALPSLHEACHEDPYKPGAGGFAEWPATKWWWGFALQQREGLHALKIHARHKTLFVSEEVAAVIDPIARSELERMEATDPDWARLLRHLSAAGPSTPEDLQTELELKPKELKALRHPLELCAAVVSSQVPVEGEGPEQEYVTELARWDQVWAQPAGGAPTLDALLVAAVRAAVVAPERELPRWFSWKWLWEPDLVDRLVDEGRLARPEPGWVAAPASA